MTGPERDPLAEALTLLSGELRELVRRHPWGHLLNGERQSVEISIPVPTLLTAEDAARASRAAEEALRDGVQALLAERLSFQPGRVLCLRCTSTECEHAVPSSSRHVFAGYGSTGLPRFTDLGQLLLERQDPRVGELFEATPRLVALAVTEDELMAELLPAYRSRDLGFRLHGQVCVGWFRVRGPAGSEGVALSLQIVSSRLPRRGWRCGLNVLGLAPDGSPLESLHDVWEDAPWGPAVRWARQALIDIQRSQERRGRRGSRPPGSHLDVRLEGVVHGLVRRLLKGERSNQRRTRHAEVRRRQGGRPTDKALADLAAAGAEQLLFDIRRETLVVLGQRGRAHIFNAAGKLVTSIRYNPGSIDRRRKSGSWRSARPEEIAELRRQVSLSQLPAAD